MAKIGDRKGTLLIVAILLIILAYGLSSFYTGRKLFLWVQLIYPNTKGFLFTCIYVLMVLLPIVGMIIANTSGGLSPSIRGVIARAGDYCLGLYLYLFLFTALFDMILLIGRILTIFPSPINNFIRFLSGLLVILLTLGMNLYGIHHAKQLKETSYTLETLKQMEKEQLLIVLISDLHLGHHNDGRYLKKIVDRINGMDADLVCIAGDIFNGNYDMLAEPAFAEEQLRRIRSRMGVYACLGNHDAGSTYQKMLEFLERSKIQLLQDEVSFIAEKLALISRKDSSPIGDQGSKRSSIEKELAAIPTDHLVILMDHQPKHHREYGNQVDLILSGHTHRGQIFPGNLITKALFDVDYGLYQEHPQSPIVIVSSGVATWGPPMRIGTESEIVKIVIEKVQKKAELVE